MRKVLRQDFFNKPTLVVAKDLLGKYLCTKSGCFMMTEVEAYDGLQDKASHAHSGRTKRNEPMFGEAGMWYVYFTYGMHWMLNIVAGPKDYPAAVLIRGLRSPTSVGFKKSDFGGPAKLTKFLKINKHFNSKKAEKKTGLWIEDRGIRLINSQIKRTPRIGVDYAGKWAKKPYRFLIK